MYGTIFLGYIKKLAKHRPESGPMSEPTNIRVFDHYNRRKHEQHLIKRLVASPISLHVLKLSHLYWVLGQVIDRPNWITS